MRLDVIAGSAALSLLAVACHATRAAGVAGEQGGPAVAAPGRESLELELSFEPRVRAGAPVRFRLRARNVGERPVDVYLRGRALTFDVVVARAGGAVAWRRLEGEIIPAIVRVRPLRPGEALEAAAVWDQRTNAGAPVGPGEYTVEGALLVEGEPLRAPARPLTIVGTRR